MASTTIPSIIAGQDVFDTDLIHPVYSHEDTNEVIHTFSYIQVSPDIINQLAENSKSGFKEWSNKPVYKKKEIFYKCLEILREKKNEFIDTHKEIGGPDWFANVNIDGAIAQLEEYIGNLSNSEGELFHSDHNQLALTVRLPIGPVLSIAPWNAPVILGARSIFAPLAAGCSVIAKSPEKAPRAMYLLVKYLIEAGVPANVLQLVHLKPEDNPKFLDALLATGAIKKINFTGSTLIGKKIASTAAKYLVPCLLELGGKNVSIVCQDADITKAVGNIIWSAWTHKGQICMSTDRVFIHDTIYNDFKLKLIKVASEMVQDPDYSIAHRDPLGANKVKELLNDALQKGASLVFGNPDDSELKRNNVVSPMILEGVTPEMKLNDTESFGPIFAIEKFTDVNNVVDVVNESDFGLKASIWSSNLMNAIDLAKRIECGGVHINNSSIGDESHLPHGGVKASGSGRFNSKWGIDEFLFIKTITANP